MKSWDNLLVGFRELGGIADNVRLGTGRFGRGLFPISSELPVKLHVPPNLLIATDDVVFENGEPRVASHALVGSKERDWFNWYQSEFSWGGGGAADVRQKFKMVQALPRDTRTSLTEKCHKALWFNEPSDANIQQAFIAARQIDFKGRNVIMPIFELCNYGKAGSFKFASGISLEGAFPEEVVVSYNDVDAYDCFHSWGFAAEQPIAYSIPVSVEVQSTKLIIRRQYRNDVPAPRVWIPKGTVEKNSIELPFLLIGSRTNPRIPQGIFYKMVRERGPANFKEIFDLIQHFNREHFLGILQALGGSDLPMACVIRDMALFQLSAMSHCFGVREID